MADRRVKVIFEAQIAGYRAAMREAAAATETLSKKGRESSEASKKQAENLQTVGTAATVVGAATVAGVGLAIKKYADFDKAMSGVQAATHESTENMGLLREAAIKAGADTAYSAQEAASGIEELAKAGVSTTDILNGGLSGALSLAAAGGQSVGDAAETAATAMTQFKLSGEDIPHIADLLAAGAGKAQGSVSDMGAALKQAGLVADSTGLSIEETTGGLAAFASAGLVGSDAGTSFKSMLQRLTPQSEKAAKLMDELGVSAYDSQGNFVGLSEYAGILQDKLSGMTAEQRNATMATLFGSDAVRAANVLYEQGAEGIEKWEGAVNDAGFAAETAAIKQDNLAGDLEKLGGAFDTVFLKSGSGANEALRGIVQGVEDFVDAIGRIPEPILSMGAMVAGVAGGAALLGGAFITVVPKILDTRNALRDLAPAGGKAATALGKVGKAAGVAGAIAGVGLVLAKISEASYMDDIDTGMGKVALALQMVADGAPDAEVALDGLFKDKDGGDLIATVDGVDEALRRTFDKSAGEKFNDFNENWLNAVTGIKGSSQILEDSWGRLDEQLATMVSGGNLDGAAAAFETITQKAAEQGISVEQLNQLFPGYQDALAGAAAESANAAGGADSLSGAMDSASTAAAASAESQELLATRLEETGVTTEGVVEDMQTFLDLLFQTGVLTMNSRDAQFAYGEQLRAVDDAVKKITESGGEMGSVLNKNKSDFNENTEAGKLANDTFQGLAKGGMAEVKALAEEGVGQDVLQKKLKGTYTDLVSAGKAFGLTGEDARTLARKVLGVPDGVTIDSWMSTRAREEADSTKAAVDRVDGTTANVYLNTHRVTIYETKGSAPPRTGKIYPGQRAAYETGGKLPGFDGGGQLPAYGLGTDTILGLDSKTAQPVAWLDDEEWVINGRNSRKYNAELAAINAGTFPKLPGYADGRAINAQPAGSFDAGSIAAAVAGAISRYQPIVNIGGRQFAGVMRDTQKQFTRH